MSKASDFRTNILNEEDRDVLTRPSFAVNMRLFHRSESYRAIVLSAAAYLKLSCQRPRPNKKTPKGVSGPNRGLPFRIIAINRKGGCLLMINPVIINYYGKSITTQTTCGAVPTEKPVILDRAEFIDVAYYDTKGRFKELKKLGKRNGGFTIQHEVDHLNGILITDPIRGNQPIKKLKK